MNAVDSANYKYCALGQPYFLQVLLGRSCATEIFDCSSNHLLHTSVLRIGHVSFFFYIVLFQVFVHVFIFGFEKGFLVIAVLERIGLDNVGFFINVLEGNLFSDSQSWYLSGVSVQKFALFIEFAVRDVMEEGSWVVGVLQLVDNYE